MPIGIGAFGLGGGKADHMVISVKLGCGAPCYIIRKDVAVGGIESSNITGLVGIHKNKRDFTILLVRKCLTVLYPSYSLSIFGASLLRQSLQNHQADGGFAMFRSDVVIYKIQNKQNLGDDARFWLEDCFPSRKALRTLC